MSISKGLYCEVGVVEGQVVLHLVECESCAAAATEVGHDHFVSGRDFLNHTELRRLQPPHDLVLHIRVDTDGGVVAFLNPRGFASCTRDDRVRLAIA